MLPDRVSNPGPLTNVSGALPIALRGPAVEIAVASLKKRGSLPELIIYQQNLFKLAGRP